MNEWMSTNPVLSRRQLFEVLSAVTFLVLLLASLSRDWHYLTQYPIAVGVDGYYYVLQVSQILKDGHLYFPSSSPFVLYSLAVLGAFIDNLVLAIKIGAVSLQFLLCVGIYALLRVTGHSRIFGYFGALLGAYVGLHLNFISEFLSNLGAIVLMIWCCVCLIKFVRNPTGAIMAASILLLIAAAFSHKSALPLILVLEILSIVIFPLLHIDRSFVIKCLCLCSLVLIFLSPALIDAQQIFELPRWLKDEITSQPQLPFGWVAFSEKLILLIVAPLTLIFVYRLPEQIRKSTRIYLGCVVAVWSLLFTLNPFLNHARGWDGIATRLDSLSYIQIAILLPSLIWLWTHFEQKAYLYVSAIFAPLLFISIDARLPSGLQPAYLRTRTQLIEQLPEKISHIAPGSIVVAEQGTQFIVTFTTGFPAQNLLPIKPERVDTYWIVSGIRPPTDGKSMETLAGGEFGPLTVLIRHSELKEYLSLLPHDERQRLFFVNSHLYQTCINAGFAIFPSECLQLP